LNTTISIGNVRAFLFYGALDYYDASSTRVSVADERPTQLRVQPGLRRVQAEEGPYLMVLTPYRVDNVPGDEAATTASLDATAGLLAVVNTPNVVAERLFDHELDMVGDRLTVRRPASRNPLYVPPPDVSGSRGPVLAQAARAQASLPDDAANRVRLALRWVEAALSGDTIDSFLKYWVAIETLAMPETNVAALNDRLARTYGTSRGEANVTFGAGRSQGLPSRIVHHGELVPVDLRLLEYARAMFTDLLYDVLDLTTEHRMQALLDEGFDVTRY